MKKTMVTKETYMPLAEKIWGFIASQYQKEPSPEEFAVILGAIEAVKFGITKTLDGGGHRFMVMHQNENPQ
jgi:hypothetical protein